MAMGRLSNAKGPDVKEQSQHCQVIGLSSISRCKMTVRHLRQGEEEYGTCVRSVSGPATRDKLILRDHDHLRVSNIALGKQSDLCIASTGLRKSSLASVQHQCNVSCAEGVMLKSNRSTLREDE